MRTYTLEDIAEMFKVGDETAKCWARSGELKCFNASRDRNSRRQRLRVTQESLDAFIASREVGGDSKPKTPRKRRTRKSIERFV